MVKIEKITYESDELDRKVKNAVENPDEGTVVEVCCYPMTDGCCIKKGAS